MQIIRLELRGIGPYVDRQVIDVAALGANGLFLMEGPTGSGKTTIIDAIVFALYGTVAADDSSRDRLASTQLPVGVEPYAELIVDTRRGLLKVRRTPAFTRPKRRGTGMAQVNSTIKLWKLADPTDTEGTPISSNIQDANKELYEAIGLSREQFTQTVVLPQGHFASFLRAKPEERRGLLQQIFGTQLYQKIQEQLAEMAADYAKQTATIRDELTHHLDQFARTAWPDVTQDELDAVTNQRDNDHHPPESEPHPEPTTLLEPEFLPEPEPQLALVTDEPGKNDSDNARANALLLARQLSQFRVACDQGDYEDALRCAAERVEELGRDVDAQREIAGQASTDYEQAHGQLESARLLVNLQHRYQELIAQRDELSKAEPQVSSWQNQLTAARRAQSCLRSIQSARLSAQRRDDARNQWRDATTSIEHGAHHDLIDELGIGSVPGLPTAGEPTFNETTINQTGIDETELQSTLNAMAGQLRTLTGSLDSAAALERGLPARDAALRQNKNEAQRLSKQIAVLNDQADQDAQRRVEINNEYTRLEASAEAMPQAQSVAEAAQRHVNAALQANDLTSELETARTAEFHARTAEQLASDKHDQARTRWLDGLAGEIAHELTSGQPCPVCGSREHPRPAVIAEGAVTKATVATLERAAQQASEAAVASRTECTRIADRLEQARKDAAGLSYEQAIEAYNTAKAALDQSVAAVTTRKKLAHDLENLQHASDQRRAQAEQNQSELARLRGVIENTQQQIDHDRKSLTSQLEGFAFIADRQQYLCDRIDEIELLSSARKTLWDAEQDCATRKREMRQALDEADFPDETQAMAAAMDANAMADLESRIDNHHKRTAVVQQGLAAQEIIDASAAPQPDLEALDAELSTARHRQEAADQQLGRLESQRASAQQAHDLAQGDAQSYATIGATAQPYLRMAELASATGPSNLKSVTLPTFVLLQRFEQVIEQANQRLESMTHGRYSLQRTDEREGRSKRQGLGLVVVDHMSADKERDPQTLSGGETFLASLAMALGLSDTVMSEAGGVELGSLFVDEGFGSLDPSALDMVMDQLERLRTGGRSVGVISHVTEMKQRIAERVSIRPQGDGTSRLTTTVDPN